MHVQVEHGLSAAGIAVDHAAIAVFGKAFALGVLRRRQQQLADQWRLGFAAVVQGRQRFVLGDEQHVHRRLRMDVAKGEDVVVFVHHVGGNLAADDLVENGIAHACSPFSIRSDMPCDSGATNLKPNFSYRRCAGPSAIRPTWVYGNARACTCSISACMMRRPRPRRCQTGVTAMSTTNRNRPPSPTTRPMPISWAPLRTHTAHQLLAKPSRAPPAPLPLTPPAPPNATHPSTPRTSTPHPPPPPPPTTHPTP